MNHLHQPIWVRGVGVWTPEAPTLHAFIAGDRAATACRPQAQLLPPRMRGRASPLTTMLADVVDQATRSAGVLPGALPSVFGSAYGEMSTTLALLSQLWAAGGDGALSPAKFQASVHNTAAAQLSIALGNSSFSTSLAAGHDTLAMVLIEACAWLSRHPGQMLVACADEGAALALAPELLYSPLAAAFVLDSASSQGLACLESLASCEHVPRPERLGDNPVSPALALAAAVFCGQRATVVVNEGAPHGYQIVVRSQVTGV